MLQKIKRAFSWLVEKVKAGVAWVRENRSWLEQQARNIARQVHQAGMVVSRQIRATYNRGRALAILTVQYRQDEQTTFRQALEQAKAEVSSMSEAEIAQMVVEFFNESAQYQAVSAAV